VGAGEKYEFEIEISLISRLRICQGWLCEETDEANGLI